jgi:hypothetical protein
MGAAAGLLKHCGPIDSAQRTMHKQANGVLSTIPPDHPPTYAYATATEKSDRKQIAPAEFTYESVAAEWLKASEKGERKPSFNGYHSFDRRQAPMGE